MCFKEITKLEKKETTLNHQSYLPFKRFFDIVLSLIVSPIVLIIILIASFFIKLDSQGPIVYTQYRMGLNGKVFKIYKLRTMINNAEEKSGPTWASVEDPRITRVGKFLRKTRIDELPQVYNVLIGNMSIIGPRPERPELTAKYEKEHPGFINRLKIKPGITGLAQVRGGYNIDFRQKLIYDLEYIEKVNFLLDIKILFATIRVVITGEGSR